MPALSARTQANRLNAQKSTGPASAQGKAASSRNATKHGLFCKDLLLEGENARDFAQMKDGLLRRLDPRDALELRVCDQIIACHWKLLRIRSAEKEAFVDRARLVKDQHAGDDPNRAEQHIPQPSPGELLFRMLEQSANPTIERLSKYEARLCSQLQKHMKELRALQEEPIRGLIHELVDEVLKEQAETPTDAQNEANEPAPDAKYLAEQQMGSALLDHRCDAEVEMRPTDINEPTESPTAVCNAGLDAPKSAA